MPVAKTSRSVGVAPRTRREGETSTPTLLATDARRGHSAALLDALRSVGRELRVSGRESEQRLGIHPAQLHALQQLAEKPCRSLAELAERTHTDPSSVSVVVQRLVERGLVERTAASDDRRRTELSVTATGRTLLRRATVTAAHRLDEAVRALPQRDLAVLTRSLVALARTLRQQEDAED